MAQALDLTHPTPPRIRSPPRPERSGAQKALSLPLPISGSELPLPLLLSLWKTRHLQLLMELVCLSHLLRLKVCRAMRLQLGLVRQHGLHLRERYALRLRRANHAHPASTLHASTLHAAVVRAVGTPWVAAHVVGPGCCDDQSSCKRTAMSVQWWRSGVGYSGFCKRSFVDA